MSFLKKETRIVPTDSTNLYTLFNCSKVSSRSSWWCGYIKSGRQIGGSSGRRMTGNLRSLPQLYTAGLLNSRVAHAVYFLQGSTTHTTTIAAASPGCRVESELRPWTAGRARLYSSAFGSEVGTSNQGTGKGRKTTVPAQVQQCSAASITHQWHSLALRIVGSTKIKREKTNLQEKTSH